MVEVRPTSMSAKYYKQEACFMDKSKATENYIETAKINFTGNGIQVFNYQDKQIRTIEKDGELWWVLKDVCMVLGIANPRNISVRLDEDEKGVHQIDTLGGKQEVTIINESGLYNVILRSDKPQAKPFRKWVTSEVIPSIRKHGAYMTSDTLKQVLLNPDTIIQLCQQIKSEQEKNYKLSEENKQLLPKAESYDLFLNTDGAVSMNKVAKSLRLGRNKMMKFLREENVLFLDGQDNIPYERFCQQGLFVVNHVTGRDGKIHSVTKATSKGIGYIKTLYFENH